MCFYFGFILGLPEKTFLCKNIENSLWNIFLVFIIDTGIILNLVTYLPSGTYNVGLTVTDNGNYDQVSTIKAEVCDCTGANPVCSGTRKAGTDLSMILGLLGGILLLLSESDIWL